MKPSHHDVWSQTPPLLQELWCLPRFTNRNSSDRNGYGDVSQGKIENQQYADRHDHQIRLPPRLTADVTPSSGALMPSTIHKQRLLRSKTAMGIRDPFFRSSDAFHDSQTETPPIENGYGDVSQGMIKNQ
ncbi:hypothetical protein N7541_011533 [Penicillium brevicompactum]|uniref:Uncharacterized protein n=1 Tax=Penicillium brevicompactum TaxID=5074 RepID=A0A9W9UJ80_PENBR|nr:hypothetical protein N7541_011533 [Penicillium brevicompactum]